MDSLRKKVGSDDMKKTKHKNLFIVDGHALAYRAHYALINQRLQDKDGNPTETLFGFFRMLAKLVSAWNPESLLIVFDPPTKNFRHDLFEQYKATRKETPSELKTQMQQLQDLTKNLGFATLIPEHAEADDLIATIVETQKDFYQEFFLVSGDKDLFSLLSPQVKMLRSKRGSNDFLEIDEEYLLTNLGIKPDMVIDFMAITGDTSDNIPGVKGIGEKGAAKLLQTYQNLEDIYKHIDEIKPAGVQKKLIESKEEAFLSKQLVTLKKDLSVDFLDTACFFENILEALSSSLHFFSDIGLHAVAKDWEKVLKKNKIEPKENKLATSSQIELDYQVITTLKQWQKIEKELQHCKEIAIDCETTSPSAMQATLLGVSISWNTGSPKKHKIRSVYIPTVFASLDQPSHPQYKELEKGEVALAWLKDILENRKIKKIGQNIKYDDIVLLRHGVKVSGIDFDTMLASYLLHSRDMPHNLDHLSLYFLNHQTVSYKELTNNNKTSLLEIELEKLSYYACEDSHLTLMLAYELRSRIEDQNLMELFRSIDLPLSFILTKMEMSGITIDKNYLSKLQKKLEKEIQKVEQEIYHLADQEFNINSTKELQEILYQKLQIKPLRKTSGGQFSTDARVLQWLEKEHPIVKKILKYRGLQKLLNTYVAPLPEFIHSQTNRVHSSFSQIVTATGRLASSEPNLQNIPVEEKNSIRHAFVSQEDGQFLSLDYSQIELRILAHYSDDPSMIEAFKKNEDIHDLAALLLFYEKIFFEKGERGELFRESREANIEFSKDSESMKQLHKHPDYAKFRSQAKVMNFSISYGVTDFGLSQSLHISREEAKDLIQMYFNRFPKIKSYMESIVKETRETKLSINFFGRQRSLPNIGSQRRPDRLAAERLAINNPIQSTAADIIKLAMIEIDKKMTKEKMQSRMLLQIHDELLFECPNSEIKKVETMAKEIMENIVKLKVPLVVNSAIGKRWDSAK